MAKKQNITADDILKQMYPDLKTSDDFVAETKPTEGSPEAKIAELTAQIATLTGKGQQNDAPRGKSRELAQLPQAPVRPIIDYSTAPDPVQKPQDYAAWVHESTAAQIEYEKANYAWQQQVGAVQGNRQQELWNDFQSSYKQYAGNAEKVGIAAQKVIEKNKAAGVNTEKYMFEDSDRFMKDVTDTYDRLFGKPKDDGNVDDNADDGDDDRTSFQGSGAPASRDGPSATPRPPEKYGALGSAVDDWQKKTGFAV